MEFILIKPHPEYPQIQVGFKVGWNEIENGYTGKTHYWFSKEEVENNDSWDAVLHPIPIPATRVGRNKWDVKINLSKINLWWFIPLLLWSIPEVCLMMFTKKVSKVGMFLANKSFPGHNE